MTEQEGWEWYYNVTSVISADIIKELNPDAIPKSIEARVRKLTSKPLQLKLDLSD